MRPSTIFLLATASALLSLTALTPSEAQAFCGFYVSGADQEMYNNATMVVMMREGTKTVLSMRNNYEGPPEDFAMVIPVPQVLEEENVKVLKNEVFTHVDQLAAPRLVEYWERDPCLALDPPKKSAPGGMDLVPSPDQPSAPSSTEFGVTVEAEFDVGEYNVVILSAKESNGLEKYLKSQKYNIPEGAAPVLKPYIEGGQYFFVAKVDPKKVKFEKGQARLSPLRFHYDSKEFSLPVRLGLLNAKGHQDLLVHILAKKQRYEVANYPNVTIPTNILVKDHVRESFGEFYATLLDRTLEENPKAVITEYAWDASTCDPCPTPALDQSELFTLGGDVLHGGGEETVEDVVEMRPPSIEDARMKPLYSRLMLAQRGNIKRCYLAAREKDKSLDRVEMTLAIELKKSGKISFARVSEMTPADGNMRRCLQEEMQKWSFPASTDPLSFTQQVTARRKVRVAIPPTMSRGWVLTRLHARYTKEDLGEDLVFKKADAIVGGRGTPAGLPAKLNEEGSKPGSHNSFQGRYIMLNPWEGKIACENPTRGIWGGPPSGNSKTRAAQDTAFIERGKFALPDAFAQKSIPGLKLEGKPAEQPKRVEEPVSETPSPEDASAENREKKKPSSCATTNRSAPESPLEALLLLAVFLLTRRTRRSDDA